MRDLHFPQHGQKIKRLLALASILSFSVFAQEAPSGNDAATLAKLREATMSSDYAYARLADLTDKIGPRLSGSAGCRRCHAGRRCFARVRIKGQPAAG